MKEVSASPARGVEVESLNLGEECLDVVGRPACWTRQARRDREGEEEGNVVVGSRVRPPSERHPRPWVFEPLVAHVVSIVSESLGLNHFPSYHTRRT